MTDFTIVEGKPWHCGQISRALRFAHLEAVARMGFDSHRELRQRFDDSQFCRAVLIDGKLGALGGVMGTRLSATGFIWCALTDEAAKHPVSITKIARRQLQEIMAVKRELVTSIMVDDSASARFAIFLGFVPATGKQMPPAFSRIGRRGMAEQLNADVDARIPVGPGYVLAMSYQRQEAA